MRKTTTNAAAAATKDADQQATVVVAKLGSVIETHTAPLLARIAELESAGEVFRQNLREAALAIEAEKAEVRRLTEERDAAVRMADHHKMMADRTHEAFNAQKQRADALATDVDEARVQTRDARVDLARCNDDLQRALGFIAGAGLDLGKVQTSGFEHSASFRPLFMRAEQAQPMVADGDVMRRRRAA